MTNGKREARESKRQAKKLMKAIRAAGVGRLKHISLSEGMSMSLSPLGITNDFIWVRSNKQNPAPKPKREDFKAYDAYLVRKKAWEKTSGWIARQELKKAWPKLHEAGIRFCDGGGCYLMVYNCHNKRLIK